VLLLVYYIVVFLNPTNYGKIIRFLKVSVFNSMSIALVFLKVVPGGCAKFPDHYRCSIGQSGHFGGSHAMKTQRCENSQKSEFCRTLLVNMSMKYWFARGEPVRDLLSDLRPL
jgi:hypothetical protein